MTDDVYDRRAELIAAALASELTPDEAAELEALRADDPTIDEDLAAFGVVLDRVRTIGSWEEPTVPPELGRRIESAVERERARGAADAPDVGAADRGPVTVDRIGPDGRVPSRGTVRRRALLVAGAAACVAVGIGGGVLLATPAAPPSGPAGALGAVEAVSFDGEPSGVDVDGDVIAHTWGTETVLTIEGLPAGDVYDVIVLDGTGREWSAGTFLGSDVPIDCRMNASVLRTDAVEVQIRADDGTEIARAALPAVAG